MSLKDARRGSVRGAGSGARGSGSGLSTGRPGRLRRRIVGPLVVVACAVVSVVVAADYWASTAEIYRGVSVGGVALGGKTPEEARGIVRERGAEALEKIRLTGETGEFTLAAGEVGLDLDVAGTVDRAYSVGRRGGVLERLGDRLAASWGLVSTAPAVGYDREALRTRIEEEAARANEEPRDARVSVDGSEVAVVEARVGYALDAAATAAKVEKAIEELSGEAEIVGGFLAPETPTAAAEEAAERAEEAVSRPAVLTAGGEEWELSPGEIAQALEFEPEGDEIRVGLDRERLRGGLSDVYEALTTEVVDAGYETAGSGVVVTESRAGRKIEGEKLLGAMETGLFEGRRKYEVPVAVAEPELTTAEAEKMKPTEIIGSYRTDYSIVPDDGARVENLDLSSDAVDGTLLAPGEVFSMNGKVSGLDYNEAKVIVGGVEQKADGGGLCQVTSTLYMAANYAGLDVTERHPHSAQLPYIRPGLDATVWWGGPGAADDLDMKFQNITDGYVLLREYVAEDGYVHAEIWGQPTGRKVEMGSKPAYRNPDSAKWVTRQTATENGETVFDGVLHTDTYGALTDEKGQPIPADEVPIAPVNP